MNSFVLLCVLVPFAVQADQTYDTYGGGSYSDMDCLHLADGNYPDSRGSPANCNTFYWACTNHRADRMDCQTGLWYDPDHDRCDSKDNVVACGGQIATTMPSPDPVTLDPSIFDCTENEDGYFVNPKEDCSPIYYACSGGWGTEVYCQSGLIFDPETMTCNKPENTFICTHTRPPPVEVTDAPATYAPPQTYAMECTGMEDGSHPHPTAPCSQHFFVCSNGHIAMQECAGKMYYDATIERCESWRNVFACSGLLPEPKPDPVTFGPAPAPKYSDLDCTTLSDGSYSDPKNPCSARFFDCSNGEAYERECQSTLLWNDEEKKCDGYDNIYACTKVRKVKTTTMLPPTSPPRESRFHCPADGFYLDSHNDCSEMYWVCYGGIDTQMFCHDGLKFNIETDNCDYWDNVFSCSGVRPQPTYASAVISDHRDVPQLPVDCTNLHDGDYRDPANDCSQRYYSCSGGVATERMCSAGLYFDDELNRCDNHDDIPMCSGNARTYPAPTQGPGNVIEYPFDCTKLDDGNYPAGTCENYYWTCTAGSTNIEHCVSGLSYDSEINKCETPDHVPSCGGHRPLFPLPDQQTYNHEPVYPFDCAALPDNAYSEHWPLPSCSHVYYMCSNGRSHEFKCAAALKFDDESKRCLLKVHIAACVSPPTTYQDSYQPAQKHLHKHRSGSKPLAPAVLPPHDQNGSHRNHPRGPKAPRGQNSYANIYNSY